MDEEEIFQKLSTVESAVQDNIKAQKRELIVTKYYSEFTINTKDEPLILNNVFITIEKDANNNITYHFHQINEQTKEIEERIFVDEKGNIHTNKELEQYLGDSEIDIEDIIDKNDNEKGKTRAVSEKVKPEEMQEQLQPKKEEPEEQIEQDLGEDIEITNYRQIKDSNLDRQMPQTFKGVEEKGTAYDKKSNRFIIVVKENGKFKMAEGIEPARPTMKSVISINEDGKEIERKVPHALMKTNDSRKELSITIGDYGYVEIGTVNRLPCNERVEMQLRQDGEGKEGERNKKQRDLIEKGGTEAVHELAHEFNDEERIIQEAEKAKVSVEEFKRYLQEVEGNTLDEKIENAHEEIEEDYGVPNRDRK